VSKYHRLARAPITKKEVLVFHFEEFNSENGFRNRTGGSGGNGDVSVN
jgi:hypothetical protein